MIKNLFGLSLFELFALTLYTIVVITIASWHELAHDEAQAWNIANQAKSIWDVTWLSQYEGHTPFWYGVLWPLTRTSQPALMQILSIALGIAIFVRLLRDKPFHPAVCILTMFGYYLGYEYTIIARPYIVAFFLCALLASSLNRRNGSLFYQCVLCSLIAFTSAFGVMISLSLMALVLSERIFKDHPDRPRMLTFSGGILIYLLLGSISVWFVIYPIQDQPHVIQVLAGEQKNVLNIWTTLITPVFPHVNRIPAGIGNWLTATNEGYFFLKFATLVVLSSLSIWFLRKPSALIAWAIALCGMIIAVQISGRLSERHLGHLFIVAFTIAWARPGLSIPFTWSRLISPSSNFYLKAKGICSAVIILTLAFHLLIGIAVSATDLLKPMTPWKKISQFIDTNGYKHYTIISSQWQNLAAIGAYQGKHVNQTFCTCNGKTLLWQLSTTRTTRNFNRSEYCLSQQPRKDENVILLTVNDTWNAPYDHQLLAQFDPGLREPGRGRKDTRLIKFTEIPEDICLSGLEE